MQAYISEHGYLIWPISTNCALAKILGHNLVGVST